MAPEDTTTAQADLETLGRRIEQASGASPEQLDGLVSGLEDLGGRLEELSGELKADFHICPQLAQRLISKQSEEEYLILLENDKDQCERLRSKLLALRENLLGAEEALEWIEKLAGTRESVDGVQDADRRRSLKNALDRLKELRDELLEWKRTARRGLEKVAGSTLPSLLGIDELLPGVRPAPRGPAGGSKGREPRHASPDRARRRTRPKPAERPCRTEAAGRDGDDDRSAGERPAERRPGRTAPEGRGKPAAAETTTEGGVGRADADAARTGLEDLARRKPFALPGLHRRVRFARCTEAGQRILRVRALMGERRTSSVTVPYHGGPTDRQEIGSLWDLPARPPREPAAAREDSFRVPGSDVLETTRKAGKEVQVLRYATCETRYFVESFEERSEPEDVPGPQPGPEDEEELHTANVPWLPGGERAEEEFDRSLELVTLHFGREVREQVEAFVRALRERKAGNGAEWRLIRVTLEIRRIPVRELVCEPRDLNRERGTWRFSVWLVGKDRRFRIRDYPRRFTVRAVTWLLAAAAAGAAVGWQLMRFAGGL